MGNYLNINPVGNMMQGTQNALALSQQVGQQRQGQDLRNFLAQNGQQVMQGDQTAISGLMGIDPQIGMQAGQYAQQNALAQQRLGISQQQLEMAKQQAAREMEQYAAQMSAQEAAAAAEKMKSIYQGAMAAPDEATYNAYLQSQGFDPADAPFSEREINAARILGYTEVLDMKSKQAELSAPQSTAGKFYADQEAGIIPADATPPGATPLVDMRGANFGGVAPEVGPGGDLISDPGKVSMPEGVDFSDATGASGWISQLGNTITDAVGLGLVDQDNERATQAMQNLATNTMITLADGVAGKPSNFLLQQFQKISSEPNSIWQGQGRTKERLNQTRAMLEQAIMMNQDVVNTSETSTLRSQARANIAKLSRLLADYDAVIKSFGTRRDKAPADGPIKADNLDVDSIKSMPIGDLRSIPEDSLLDLSDDAFKAVLERLEAGK